MAKRKPTTDPIKRCTQCSEPLKKGQDRFCSRRCVAKAPRPEREIPIWIRFWGHVAIGTPEECWPWLAYRSKLGYGRIKMYGWLRESTTLQAHRLAYELFFECRVPPDMFVCHHCDNPPCCNPSHLFVGTPRDNTHDAMIKGRMHSPASRKRLLRKLRAEFEG